MLLGPVRVAIAAGRGKEAHEYRQAVRMPLGSPPRSVLGTASSVMILSPARPVTSLFRAGRAPFESEIRHEYKANRINCNRT
jgi:hypothetical protein